jgi:hypothetical protein
MEEELSIHTCTEITVEAYHDRSLPSIVVAMRMKKDNSY